MSSATLQRGDLVVARFRPDNVGVVERVYGELCDLRRPGREPLRGVPVKALTPILPGVTLYAVGKTAFGVIWTEGVVAGIEGLLCWLHGQTPEAVAQAGICIVDRRLQPYTPWEPVAGILAKEEAAEPVTA